MVAGLMVPIQAQVVTVTSNGSGVGSGSITGAVGEILGVYVDLGTGMLTLALTITTDVGDTLVNAVTVTADKLMKIRAVAVKNDNSTEISNAAIPYITLGGTITVAIASATASKTVVVSILYR